MRRSLFLLGVFYFIAVGYSISAQQSQTATTESAVPGLRGQALDITVESRILENQVVVWNEVNQKVAMQGSPVGIQLVGSNVIIVMQFTPYIRNEGSVLATQGQIWITNNNILTYYTSMQTISFELGVPIHFFPLGSEDVNPSIEIIISIKPYSENRIPSGSASQTNR